MKIDGKEIARMMASRQAKNKELEKEGHVSNVEQEAMGDHIKAMASFIEHIHHKNPEAAHEHMEAYLRARAKKDVKESV